MSTTANSKISSFTLLAALFALGTGALSIDSKVLTPRVVNGQPATTKKPWIMSIHDAKDIHFCGANLIAENIAITAAHCFAELPKDKVVELFSVVTNRLNMDMSKQEDGGVRFKIVDYALHPEYSTEKQYQNDIAVILLKPESTPNLANLTYVALDETNGGRVAVQNGTSDFGWFQGWVSDVDKKNPLNRILHIAGWGVVDPEVKVASPILNEANMEIVETDDCADELDITPNEEHVICAIGDKAYSDTCYGDSGSPLYTDDNGKQTLVGITSFGVECASTTRKWFLFEKQLPAVYTSVTAFKSWIFEQEKALKAAHAVKAMESKKPAKKATHPTIPARS